MPARPLLCSIAVATAFAAAAAPAAASDPAFLSHFNRISDLASTVPASGAGAGDQNPYGTAVVPRTVGDLKRGDVLVSNFNDVTNQQGTGSTIVEVSPASKHARVFARVPASTCAATGGVGLTTALVALRNGDVVVGSLPAPGGMIAGDGCLIVLDRHGAVARTFSGGDIQGPWDMTAVDRGDVATLFFTNVLTGNPVTSAGDNGNVVRAVVSFSKHGPQIVDRRVVATGFPEHLDPNALVVGPTGVGLGEDGTLYVADTAGNRIAAVPDAMSRHTAIGGGGLTVTRDGGLNGPLGLALAPDEHVLTVNAGDGKIVETNAEKREQVASTVLVGTKPAALDGAGDLFGLAVAPDREGVYFVDDAGTTTASMGQTVGSFANSLELLH